jgi:hypothetical protein
MYDRTRIGKAVDFSKTSVTMQHAIQAFVMRRGSVSLRVIQKWFCATPAYFVAAQVDDTVQSGKITMRRNGTTKRAGYVYEADTRDS